MGLVVDHEIFLDIPTFIVNLGISCGILWVPNNIVMDMNNVILGMIFLQ